MADENTDPPKKKSPIMLILAGVFGGIILVGGGLGAGYFLFGGNQPLPEDIAQDIIASKSAGAAGAGAVGTIVLVWVGHVAANRTTTCPRVAGNDAASCVVVELCAGQLLVCERGGEAEGTRHSACLLQIQPSRPASWACPTHILNFRAPCTTAANTRSRVLCDF